MRTTTGLLGLVGVVLGCGILLHGQERRPVTPADCVGVRYIKSVPSNEPASMAVSPDGRRIAYLVKAADLKANKNRIELYVQNLSSIRPEAPPLEIGDLTSMHWLGDSRTVMLLAREDGATAIRTVDVVTGASRIVLGSHENIDEYVTDRNGDEVVFAATTPAAGIQSPVTPREIAAGYRIPFGGLTETAWPIKRLYVARRNADGWTAPEPIEIESPFDHSRLSSFEATDPTLWLSLSPNGEELSLQYLDHSTSLPERWLSSPWVRFARSINTQMGQRVSVLYNLRTGQTSMPFETPFATSIPLWSPSGHSFVVFAKPPVGSEWERREEQMGPGVVRHGHTADLFQVEPDDGRIDLVATHAEASNPYIPPLYWGPEGNLLVAELDGTIARLSRDEGGVWRSGRTVKLSIPGAGRLVSDGVHILGEMEGPSAPPALFLAGLDDGRVQVFARLNPQFDALALAPVKDVHWRTSAGKSVVGRLFLPPDYREGTRYPLVIQTRELGDWFACDYGPSHFPSFEPEPFASAGIAYLGFHYEDDQDGKGLEEYFPRGYPGGIDEAAFAADTYDQGVEALTELGIVDRKRVGIIGFSRSGWYTEFSLIHGQTPYRAASVADNVEYSFTEFAMGSLTGLGSGAISAMYGGAPYGNTLPNWLRYSTSFNVDRIHTPLLIEEMGYGRLFDRRDAPPINLARAFELFTGLNLLKRPAELYYYPTEGHEPDSPSARYGNLQRNLDWFRFWLEDYERPDQDPEVAKQYARWRDLRDLQNREDREGQKDRQEGK